LPSLNDIGNKKEKRMIRVSGRHQSKVLKGLVAGCIGGIVASWAMNQFQALLSEPSKSDEESRDKKSTRQQGKSKQKKQEAEESGKEDATVKAATAVSEGVFDHKLTKSEKETAGPAVHYAMGMATGAIYGAMAEIIPPVTMGAGLPFGTVVWLIADEVAVPALGLSKPPNKVPISKHAYALASHFVYGLATEFMRRVVRKAV
jgi:hypothetical protein